MASVELLRQTLRALLLHVPQFSCIAFGIQEGRNIYQERRKEWTATTGVNEEDLALVESMIKKDLRLTHKHLGRIRRSFL